MSIQTCKQSCYLCSGYSIETTLFALVNDLRKEIGQVSASLLILLHLLAFFDTTNHGIFLEQDGLVKVSLAFVEQVPEGGGERLWLLTLATVQFLSPMLFNITMNLLGKVIRRYRLQCHQYAHDTQLAIPSNPKGTPETLNYCLEEGMA